MTRVLDASHGSLLAEYAKERRLTCRSRPCLKPVINAFLAADKNFTRPRRPGSSGRSAARRTDLRAELRLHLRPQGASTITQQVAVTSCSPMKWC